MRVFISSTFEDLKAHRDAVREVVRRLGHEPIAMEDFGSRPQEPKVAALGEVAGCDVLIGIYAHRYGTIPAGDDASITEQEFDQARKLRIPCYCYRVDPTHPWPPQHIDADEGRKRLQPFLKKVDALLRSAFTDSDDLAKKVAADLGRHLSPAARPLPALHALPSPPPDFVGREDQIKELLDYLARGQGAVVSGIAGMGGVGKTALALLVAHQLVERYPDAQLFIDLKGTSSAPMAPSDAMQRVVHAFEPQADLRQVSDEELSSMYRTVLSGRRVLLLMDNVLDVGQVKPLLPPPGSLLLTTSRRYFTLPGLHPLRLDVMEAHEAANLLTTVCERINGQADEIARLCGYLPLALRIAGSTLAEHADLAPAEYVRHLADRKQRLGLLKSAADAELDVEATLACSYERLAGDAQACWRMLAVFPAPFRAPAAAEVWGEESERARRLLSELLRHSIVDYDETADRYRLHDLLADFAHERMSDEEADTGRARHAAHYLKVAAAANELYLGGKEGVLAGLALFDADWSHIRAGHEWAATNSQRNQQAARQCCDYPNAAAYCLDLRLHRRDLASWLHAAVSAAQRLLDRHAEGAHLGNLGLPYAALGETRTAITYYEQALAIAREIGNRRGEGNSLGNLGNAYAALGETRRAIEYHERALAIALEIGDRCGEGNRLANLGNAYADLAETRRAIEYFEQALAIAREIGDRLGEGNSLGNLGNAYADLEETRRAIEYHEQALAIAREIGDRRGEGNRLGNLGLAYAALGETRRAIEYFEQALAIAREIGDRRAEGSDLGNLGSAYAALGETRRAIEYYEQALAIARETGDRRGEGNHLFNLSVAYERIGDRDAAMNMAEDALKVFEAIQSPLAQKAQARLGRLRDLKQTTHASGTRLGRLVGRIRRRRQPDVPRESK